MSGDAVIHRKEESLSEKWAGVKDHVPIHQIQYSFDTPEREQAFVRNQFPTDAEMARYRWYREEWHRRPKESDPGPAPLAVTCELVSSCDLSCGMCYTITDDFRNAITGAQRIMPWPVVAAVIDECAELGVCSLLLSWRGEPTLYRWRDGERTYTFPDAVRYARQKGILEITAITHGQLIDDPMAQAIVDAEPSWISVSIDGLGEDYNKIRTPKSKQGTDHDAFAVVLGNVRRLVQARRAAGKTRPQLRSNTIFPAIARDPAAYRATLVEAGIDMLTVNELLDLRAGELPADAVNQDWGCQYPFQRLTVSANGIILPCTGAFHEQSGLVLGRYRGTEPKVTRAVDGRVAIADMPPTTLAEAWHSPKLQEIRRLHDTGCRRQISPGCRDCNHGAKKLGAERLPDQWDLVNMRWAERERRG